MIKILFLLTLTTYLFSTTISNHNIYKQDNSVDLMLTFDTPYLGKISQKKDKNSTILMIGGLKLEKGITKKVNSNILQQIHILPYENQTFVKVDAKNPFTITASKTVDNFGLRIRIKSEKIAKVEPIKERILQTKKESDISGSFFKVIAVLIFLLLLLYFLKRWIENSKTTSSNWLFHKDPDKKQDIKVIKQKALDQKNRAVLLEFNDTNYLVILGNNNILLDKYESNSPNKEEKFNELLNQKSYKLDEMIQERSDKKI